ncbi:MAG: PHA/PHB synthase family protein [Gammaproteobacteria bacterium]
MSADDTVPEPAETWLSEADARRLDDLAATWAGNLSRGLPLPRIAEAYLDWGLNLTLSPGRQLELAERFVQSGARLAKAFFGTVPETDDARFAGDAWQRKPFAWFALAAREREAFWDLACAPLPGMNRHNAALMRFYTQQILEFSSPANVPLLNPQVLQTTRQEHGRNLLRGAQQALTDGLSALSKQPQEHAHYRVGENLAVTPGKVIYRNALMELIQYTPTTDTVYAEPVLIVPAWIMKYYILDLSTSNSLVHWLVAQGHTVFMISWKNPGSEDRDLSMEDYRTLGVLEALKAVSAIVPRRKIHVAGYCVGGTLLAITLAAMARAGGERLKTATLFAAQTDFEDAGELKLFIDEMALYWLDRQMAHKGYLDSAQMGGAFSLLRSRSLIWSRLIHDYWLGESDAGFDIMAWNADGTRMPRRMHIDYLRDLYLENRFAQGKYVIGGHAVSMGDVNLPMFVVGTLTDHVAPWKSVYKIRNLKRLGETTFALTNGGHNAGIVSEPGRPRRYYQLGSWNADAPYESPEDWAAHAPKHEGSWWPAWQAWLAEHSGKERVAPPATGTADQAYKVLGDAPGTYVLQR